MVAKASIIEIYARADAAGRVDIICKNYSNFMWYVIAWIVITVVCSLLMSIYVPFCKEIFSPAVYNILITVI